MTIQICTMAKGHSQKLWPKVGHSQKLWPKVEKKGAF